jgi:WD40 repeat protein
LNRFFLIAIFCISSIFAKDLEPFLKIDVNATAKDIVLKGDNELVIGTDSSELKVYNYIDKKFTKIIKIPKIKDFMGDIIDARVASVDYLNGKYMLLSDSGIGGYTDIRIHENNVTRDIFTEKDKLAIIKAKFVDDNNILLGFLSNEVALYNLKDKKFVYREQLSESKFSDFALNEDKSLAAFACESGEVDIVNTKNGKVIKKLTGANLDNIYKVDFKKDIVSCAGKDRRASWYNIKSGKSDFIQGNFFIYATALNPDATKAAYAMDENNYISIYSLSTKSKEYLLKGHKSTLNMIIFKDNYTLFSASNDNIVIMWKLK